MRTTVRLYPHLLAEAKRVAAENGRTLTAVIEDALRESLTRRGEPRTSGSVKIPTFRGQGIQPGIDLDSTAALLEAMEANPDSPGRQHSAIRSSRRRS
jgi:hypothetical protein